MKSRLVATTIVAFGLLATVGIVAVADVPNPDPCDQYGTNRAYLDCRLDRIEKKIDGDYTTPSPSPSATPTPSQTPTPSVTPSPSVTSSETPTPSVTPTPSQTPTPTPTQPAGDFPNADNTGVPAEVNLTTYTGPCVITVAGTVIDSKNVTCDLDVRTTNVVVKNSKLRSINIDDNFPNSSFTITDSEVHQGDRVSNGIGKWNFTATRVEVTGGNRSIWCERNCTVRDSYMHGQMSDETGVAHESAIRMGEGSNIIHNTIVCDAPDIAPDAGCSANLTGYGDFAAIKNNLIERNLFKATPGGYCAYGGSSKGKPFSDGVRDIRFIDNVFERGSNGKCGWWGPISDFDTSKPGNVWSGNVWDNGGTVSP